MAPIKLIQAHWKYFQR